MSTRAEWLTGAAFAKLAGCTAAAVSQAKGVHRVRTGQRGLFNPRDPVNALFIQAQALKRRAHSKPTEKPAAQGGRPGARGAPVRGGGLIERKMRADIRLKTRQGTLVEIRTQEKKKNLVPLLVCEKWFASLSANLRTFLTDLPGRVTPALIAKVQTGKDGEVQAELENEIHDAIERVLAATDRDTQEYLK